MITSAVVIAHLQSGLAYTIREAKTREEDTPALAELPVVTVGYGPIRGNTDLENASLPQYNLQGEQLTQSIYVTFICPVASFDTVFKAVFKQLVGWNSIPSETVHTSFTYALGEPIALSAGILWFVTEWKIGFPVVTLL